MNVKGGHGSSVFKVGILCKKIHLLLLKKSRYRIFQTSSAKNGNGISLFRRKQHANYVTASDQNVNFVLIGTSTISQKDR